MDAARADKNPRRLACGHALCDSSTLRGIGLVGGRTEKHLFAPVFPLGCVFLRHLRSEGISQILLFGPSRISGGDAFKELGRDVPVFDSSLCLVAKGYDFPT